MNDIESLRAFAMVAAGIAFAVLLRIIFEDPTERTPDLEKG